MKSLNFLIGLELFTYAMESPTAVVKPGFDDVVSTHDYHTFSWRGKANNGFSERFAENSTVNKHFKKVVSRELEKLDFREAKPDDARVDFLIDFKVSVKNKPNVIAAEDAYCPENVQGFGNCFCKYDDKNSYAENTVQYRESTFVIDFIDPKTGRLVWRGSFSGVTQNREIRCEQS